MAFSTKVCGLEEVRREPELKAGFVSNGNTHHDVELVQVTAAGGILMASSWSSVVRGRCRWAI
jgi:hypothetical protein